MPKIVSYSDKLIVFEDYNDFNKYQRIDKDTISNNSVRKIAMWYKTLHSHNELYETSCKEYFSLANINKIIAATNAKVVITSTIRDKAYFPGVLKFLLENNIPVIATTKVLNYQKGEEIKRFLKENPVNNYIILDDDYFAGFELPNFVQTNFNEGGLTEEKSKEAIRKLTR